MTIQKTRNETALTIALSGRLDTVTAPELEAVLKDALSDVSELTFDFEKLDYISSFNILISFHRI